MAEVIWTAQALEDIDNIAEYIARDSFTYALIQTVRFFDRAIILESNPLAGRIVPELNRKNISELILENYRMVIGLDPKKKLQYYNPS